MAHDGLMTTWFARLDLSDASEAQQRVVQGQVTIRLVGGAARI